MIEKQNEDIAIKVTNVHKTFKIPLSGNTDLKQRIVRFRSNKKGYYEFSPLNGISFEVKKGEFFGIVGRNGSGKSTLLKTIAGIYSPDQGGVKVNGKLVPFIELGVGFNPELTGRENVFLNGALLGFSRDEMNAMYDEIVDFAELHDFMNERLKNYSSGMQVRLAFSIAIRAQGDILLLDEVLAVGDSAFQQKCFSYFYTLRQTGRTVILVTHSMSAVQKFCDRALLLDGGKIKEVGSSDEIAELYEDLFINDSNKKKKKDSKSIEPVEQWEAEVVASIKKLNKSITAVKFNEWFTINLSVVAKSHIFDGNIGVNIRDERNNIIFSTDTRLHVGSFSLNTDDLHKAYIDILNKYTNGKYFLDVHVVDESRQENAIVFKKRAILEFNSSGVLNHAHSMFHPDIKIRLA